MQERDFRILKGDVRMQEWAVRNGRMTREEVDQAKKELPDVSNNATPITLEDRAEHH